VTRIAWYEKLAEDLEIHLADDDLDLRLRHRYTCDVAMLLHKVSELMGEPTRTTIQFESAPALRHHVVGGASSGGQIPQWSSYSRRTGKPKAAPCTGRHGVGVLITMILGSRQLNPRVSYLADRTHEPRVTSSGCEADGSSACPSCLLLLTSTVHVLG
jgi:hypothetical protein